MNVTALLMYIILGACHTMQTVIRSKETLTPTKKLERSVNTCIPEDYAKMAKKIMKCRKWDMNAK
jgi:hypothetical protein